MFVLYLACLRDLLTSRFLFLLPGSKGEHETPVPAGDRTTVQPVSQTRQVQEAPLFTLFLPQCVIGKTKVPHAGLEHSVRL